MLNIIPPPPTPTHPPCVIPPRSHFCSIVRTSGGTMNHYTFYGKFVPEDDLPCKCPHCGKGYQDYRGLGKHLRTCPCRPVPAKAAAPAPAPLPRPLPAETPATPGTSSSVEAQRICQADGMFAISAAAPDSGEFRRRSSQHALALPEPPDTPPEPKAPPEPAPGSRGRKCKKVGTPADGRRGNRGAPNRRRRETAEIRVKVQELRRLRRPPWG